MPVLPRRSARRQVHVRAQYGQTLLSVCAAHAASRGISRSCCATLANSRTRYTAGKRHNLYIKPKPPAIDRTGAAMQYIGQPRHFRQTAAAYHGVGVIKREVVFPILQKRLGHFKPVSRCSSNTVRRAKLDKGERKARREGHKPVLFGMHLCQPKNGTLYLFEGEFDAMAGYQAHGGNCVPCRAGARTSHGWTPVRTFFRRYDSGGDHRG